MTLKEKIKQIKSTLAVAIGEREAYWSVRDIIEDVLGYGEVDILLKGDDDLSDFCVAKIDKIVSRRLNGEPLQHILGWARFAGNRFMVTPHTLIPRPETQELVDMIIARNRDEKDLRVIDVGTGSGCIAITLARGLKFANVSAIDISEEALSVAKVNAGKLNVKVDFKCRDALAMHVQDDEQYDIIVSNPPYIIDSERSAMERMVLDYEPSTALFVPDDDALRFYQAIAEWGREVLVPGGSMYFEFNPLFASEMVALMQKEGYEDVEVVKDMQGRDRMLCAKFPKKD